MKRTLLALAVAGFSFAASAGPPSTPGTLDVNVTNSPLEVAVVNGASGAAINETASAASGSFGNALTVFANGTQQAVLVTAMNIRIQLPCDTTRKPRYSSWYVWDEQSDALSTTFAEVVELHRGENQCLFESSPTVQLAIGPAQSLKALFRYAPDLEPLEGTEIASVSGYTLP